MSSIPCNNCPWRKDSPRGHWANDHFQSIYVNCQDDGLHTMLCHKATALPAERQGELPCRGWLIVIGLAAIGVRLLLMQGRIGLEDLKRGKGCPPLFANFDTMLRANGIERPPRNNWGARTKLTRVAKLAAAKRLRGQA